jgi:hypothetical protein
MSPSECGYRGVPHRRRSRNPIQLQAARSNAGAHNRDVKRAPFLVLIGASMPSALTAIGFLRNDRDEDNSEIPPIARRPPKPCTKDSRNTPNRQANSGLAPDRPHQGEINSLQVELKFFLEGLCPVPMILASTNCAPNPCCILRAGQNWSRY